MLADSYALPSLQLGDNLVHEKDSNKPFTLRVLEKYRVMKQDFFGISLDDHPLRVMNREQLETAATLAKPTQETKTLQNWFSSIKEVYENQRHIFMVQELLNPFQNSLREVLDSRPNLKVVCISDTHSNHDALAIPDGDILIHAGDFTEHGKVDEVIAFNRWLGALPHKHKIVVAGNHDTLFQNSPEVAKELLTNATYLFDNEVEIEGFRIYGSPWGPRLPGSGSFYLNRGSAMLAKKWKQIPANLDMLITHTPPGKILDKADGKSVGCLDLAERIKIAKPKLHVFGHIHEGYGYREDGTTTFINAASTRSSPYQFNAPIVYQTSLLNRSKLPLASRLVRSVLRIAH